jgi:hypothetical protein
LYIILYLFYPALAKFLIYTYFLKYYWQIGSGKYNRHFLTKCVDDVWLVWLTVAKQKGVL